MKIIFILFATCLMLAGQARRSFSLTAQKPAKAKTQTKTNNKLRGGSYKPPGTYIKKSPVPIKHRKTNSTPKKAQAPVAEPAQEDKIKTFIDSLENHPRYLLFESSFSSDGVELGKYFKDYALAVGIRLRSYTIGGIFALSNVYRKYFFNTLNISLGISIGNKKFKKVQENFFEAEVDRSKIYEQYNVFDVEKEFLELATELGIGIHHFVGEEFFFGVELAAIYFPLVTIVEPDPLFYEEASEKDIDMIDKQLKSYAQQPGFSALSLQISLLF